MCYLGMGRSNGYRPKAAVREKVLILRERLSELTDDQWVKATYIMQEITQLLGHSYGPTGGKIEPRVCRFCRHYGHTRQHCKIMKQAIADREQREMEALSKEQGEIGARLEAVSGNAWTRWTRLAADAYRDLCAIKEEWDPDEWAVEFRKRAGEFDFTNDCIIFHS